MPSRESYLIGVAVLSVLIAQRLFALLDNAGYIDDWRNLMGFLIITGLGVAVPQLYLARTGTSVPYRWRSRFVILGSIVLGGIFSSNASSGETRAIWLLVGMTVIVLVTYEFRSGYLERV